MTVARPFVFAASLSRAVVEVLVGQGFQGRKQLPVYPRIGRTTSHRVANYLTEEPGR